MLLLLADLIPAHILHSLRPSLALVGMTDAPSCAAPSHIDCRLKHRSSLS